MGSEEEWVGVVNGWKLEEGVVIVVECGVGVVGSDGVVGIGWGLRVVG